MRLGATWFNRIGAIILLLAVVFFVKYSFDQGWLGPRTRVLMGAATGLLLIAGGEYSLARKLRQFAVGLIGGGVAMLYVAAYSAHEFYGLIDLNTAFICYCSITAVGTALAVHGRMQAVAILTLIGAFLTPIVLSTGRNAQLELLSYLLIVDAGFLAVGSMRRWDALRVLSWIGTAALFLGWGFKFYDSNALEMTLGFVAAFYVLFHGEALAAARLDRGEQKVVLPGIVHACNVACYSAIYFLANDEHHRWMGLFTALFGMAQWGLAWIVGRADRNSVRTQVSLAIDGAFILALVAPIQFNNATVAIAWGVQSVACLFFARWIPDLWLRVKALGVLAAAIIHLIIVDRDNPALLVTLYETSGGLWHLNNLILLSAGLSVCAFAGALCMTWRRQADAQDSQLAAIFACIGLGLLMGISAYQYDRYIATTCWLVVFLAVMGIGQVLPAARSYAVGMVLITAMKFIGWDLIAATDQCWADLTGVVLNRAVYCGAAVAAALVLSRSAVAAMQVPRLFAASAPALRPASEPAVFAILVILATGTFEIFRVFKFESVGLAAANPRFAMHLWLSMFWSVTAIVSLILGMVTDRRELRYLAVAVFALTIMKAVFVDLSYLATIYRVISFAVLGVLLLVASLFYQKRFSRLNAARPGAGPSDA